MSTLMQRDPVSGMILPSKFIDEKVALKKVIDELVEKCVLGNQHIDRNYFLTLHARFDKINSSQFVISKPVITFQLPPFTSNQFVFWISNKRGICELLWMVPAKKRGKKINPIFNTKGVAYLQAKGAMLKPE